jgi:hypothetical protein
VVSFFCPRSKVKGHVGGGDAKDLAHAVLTEHQTFANHFTRVTTLVVDGLSLVDRPSLWGP